ncbi:MAG: hypothetical protein ACR2LE_09400 [Nocardioidaceae bacterium]
MHPRWWGTRWQRHDFGDERVGTVYRPVTGGWQPYLPARFVLRLSDDAGLVVDAGFPGARLVGTRRNAPRSLSLLGAPAGTDLRALIGALGTDRHWIKVLDLSDLEPGDFGLATPNAPLPGLTAGRLRIKSVVAPAWMTSESAGKLLGALEARTTLRQAPALVAASRSGDVEAFWRIVSQAVIGRDAAQPPTTAEFAVSLAATYLDVNRPADALAVLAPWLGSDLPRAFVLAADAMLALDAPSAAIAACQIGAQLSAGDALPLVKQADVLRLHGAPGAAALAAERVLATHPSWSYPLIVLGFAYVQCAQIEAASVVRRLLGEVAPSNRDTLYLHALIESSRAESVTRGGRILRRHAARKQEAVWLEFLRDFPSDVRALDNLAAAQRIGRPWSRRWATTSLRALDEGNHSSTAGTTVADLVVEHPKGVAASAAVSAGAGWFIAAIDGGVPPVSIGWPIVLAGATGAAMFGWMRSRLPARAVLAAKRLNRRTSNVWGVYAALVLTGLVLALEGVAVVRPDPPCVTAGTPCSVPTIPPQPSIPSVTVPTSFPTVPTISLIVPTGLHTRGG